MGFSPRRVVALVAMVLAGAPASAQGTGDGFLFKPPAGTFTIRCGFDRASAGSDIFSFVTDQLTLSRSDFNAVTLAIDVGVRIGPRVQAVFGLGSSRTSTPSEFRHWVDNTNQPIQQTTSFVRAPITASLKVYLAGPGRSVGRFAWVPARYAPYVGGGGGIMLYRFRQDGDFIDFTTTNSSPTVSIRTGLRRRPRDSWAPK
jgi:hypothetical protein